MEENQDLNLLADWLKQTVAMLVEVKHEVHVEQSADEMGILFTLKVDPKDAGRIIGKQGVTITGLRNVLRAIGGTYRSAVSLKLDVPDKTDRYEN